MKQLCYWVKIHWKEDFNPAQYSLIVIFLGISLFLSYHIDFQNKYLTMLSGWQKFAGFFVLYAISYFVVTTSYALIHKRGDIFKDKIFWQKSVLILIVLGLDNSTLLRPLVSHLAPEIQSLMLKVSIHFFPVVIVFAPLLCYYFIKEKKDTHVYGLRPAAINLKPYFIILILMMPVICLASFHESFLNQYPLYKTSSAHVYFGVHEWFSVMLFETSYAFDFISVEFIFRGFMVIGLASILGRNAVLTMAVVYCFLHFGKPPAEAISSIAGGYILGVIAYETKSIWGGVLIHVGIAWAMELASFLQKHS